MAVVAGKLHRPMQHGFPLTCITIYHLPYRYYRIIKTEPYRWHIRNQSDHEPIQLCTQLSTGWRIETTLW